MHLQGLVVKLKVILSGSAILTPISFPASQWGNQMLLDRRSVLYRCGHYHPNHHPGCRASFSLSICLCTSNVSNTSTSDNVSGHTVGCGGNSAGRNPISGLRKEEDTKAQHVLLQKEKKVQLHVRMLNYLLMSLMRAAHWAWHWAWLYTCFCIVKKNSAVIHLKKKSCDISVESKKFFSIIIEHLTDYIIINNLHVILNRTFLKVLLFFSFLIMENLLRIPLWCGVWKLSIGYNTSIVSPQFTSIRVI